jgi:hypothetical protein
MALTKQKYFDIKWKDLPKEHVPEVLADYYEKESIEYDAFDISPDRKFIRAAALGLPPVDLWEAQDGTWIYLGTDDQFYDYWRCNHCVGDEV